MFKPWWALGVCGWLSFLALAFCGNPGIDIEVTLLPDAENGAMAADADEGKRSGEPVGAGQLSVVDSEGRLVGVVVARTHRLLEHNELFDAVQVFHPASELFFSVRMASGEVLRPGKIFFSGGNCSGAVAVRAMCPDCPSGFNLAFSYKGTWYRVPDGLARLSFKYASYVAEEGDAQCTGHGNSSTQVYPVEALEPQFQLGSFVPPLRFVWGP